MEQLLMPYPVSPCQDGWDLDTVSPLADHYADTLSKCCH